MFFQLDASAQPLIRQYETHIHLQVRSAVWWQRGVDVPSSRTDLVEGSFHHRAGAQDLRLGSCCLYVLQVLLPDLQTVTFQVMKQCKTCIKNFRWSMLHQQLKLKN